VSARLEKTTTPGIYRRGNRYVVTFRDQHGTPRKKSAATLAQARDLKAAVTTDVRRGDYQPQTTIAFADYVKEWISTYQGRTSRGIRPETLLDYKADLTRDAIPFFKGFQLHQIQPRDLKRYAAHLAARGLAPSSVRSIIAPLRALLATAYEDGLIRNNPASRLRLAQPSQHQTREHRKALSEHELHHFLSCVPAEWRLFFELLAHTGLRISEAVALHWDDIDLETRRLEVKRRYYRGRIDTPKSDYGLRTIPLAPNLAHSLQRRRATRPEGALIFPSQAGTYLEPSNLRRRVLDPATKNAGLSWVGFHSFRHTCATTLFNHGLNLKQVQTWLGHHSAAFTLATYIHLLPDQLPNPDFLDAITTRKPESAEAHHGSGLDSAGAPTVGDREERAGRSVGNAESPQLARPNAADPRDGARRRHRRKAETGVRAPRHLTLVPAADAGLRDQPRSAHQ
jgi:integrase